MRCNDNNNKTVDNDLSYRKHRSLRVRCSEFELIYPRDGHSPKKPTVKESKRVRNQSMGGDVVEMLNEAKQERELMRSE